MFIFICCQKLCQTLLLEHLTRIFNQSIPFQMSIPCGRMLIFLVKRNTYTLSPGILPPYHQEYSHPFTRNTPTLSPGILPPYHQEYPHYFTWHAHLVRKPGQVWWLCSLWLFSKNIGFYVWYEQNGNTPKFYQARAKRGLFTN